MKLEPDQLYMFAVTDKKWAAPAIDGIVTVAGKSIEELNFRLLPATRIHGRFTSGADGKPATSQKISLHQHGRGLHELAGVTLPNSSSRRRKTPVQPEIVQIGTTDDKGEFEFFAGPGNFTLEGAARPDEKTVEITFFAGDSSSTLKAAPQMEGKTFEITDQSDIELNFGGRTDPEK